MTTPVQPFHTTRLTTTAFTRWKSVSAAKPELTRCAIVRLCAIIHRNRVLTALDISQHIRIARGKYFEDLELLTGNKLSEVKGIRRNLIQSRYIEIFKPLIVAVYEELLSGARKKFPDSFWESWQGKLNFMVCFQYLLEEKCGIEMQKNPRKIDARLFRANQAAFLTQHCGRPDWTHFIRTFKLEGGFGLTYGKNTSNLMRSIYPWAFHLGTSEGNHLHPDEFKQNRMWQGSRGARLAKKMVDHRFRKHLGILMDSRKKVFDQRLLRENQAALLKELGFSCWRDIFISLDLDGLLVSRPEFKGKVGHVLKFVYPWAFDWTKPEGEHLHAHDFEAKAVFTSSEELRQALLHETEQEGWILQELPQMVNKQWLIDHGLSTVSEMARVDLFKKAFAAEFAHGFFTEADFRNLGTARWERPAPLRKIKRTKARKTNYGIIHMEKTVYYFDDKYVGYLVRKESEQHAVVFKITKIAGHRKQISRLTKAFILPLSSGSYNRPDLIDYNKEEHPILPRDIKEKLFDMGITPHKLTLQTQKELIKFIRHKGDRRLLEFLRLNGIYIR